MAAVRLPRPGLLERLEPADLGLVEAPGGWGKSVLAGQMYDAWRGREVVVAVSLGGAGAVADLRRGLVRASRASGLTDAAVRLEHASSDVGEALVRQLDGDGDELVVLVDDCHEADEQAGELLAELADAAGGSHHLRLVLLGRTMPMPVRRVADRLAARGVDVVRLGAGDLRMSVSDVARLCDACAVPDTLAEELADASHGWAATVAVAISAIADGQRPETVLARLATGGGEVRPLIDSVLDRLAESDRRLAEDLAALPRFDAQTVERSGGAGTLARWQRAGVPITEEAGGWLSFAGPFGEALNRGRPPSSEVVRVASGRLLERREWAEASALLLRAGQPMLAAAAAAHARPGGLEDLPIAPLAAVVDALPAEQWADHLDVLVSYAVALEQHGQADRLRAFLDDARDRLADDAVGSRWVRAESSYKAGNEGTRPRSEVVRECRELLGELGQGEPLSRIRVLETLGRLLSMSREARDLSEARERFGQAVSLALTHDAPRVAIRVLQTQSYHLGTAHADYRAAEAALVECLRIASRPGPIRCRLLGYRADVLMAAGDLPGALEVLADYDRIRDFASGSSSVMTEWTRAVALTMLGDRDGAGAARARVEASPVMSMFLGVWFAAELAMAQSRVGWQDDAKALLTELAPRRDEQPMQMALAELAVLAREPQVSTAMLARARELVHLLEEAEDLEERDRFRLPLFLAAVLTRAGGRAEEVRGLVAQAGTAAADVDRSLLHRGEPDLAELLLVELQGPSSDSWEVQALGPMRVTRDGQPVQVPHGKPQLLVAVLALRPDPTPIDLAVSLLWPQLAESERSGQGRQRLRNVLARVRGAAGPLVVRDGDVLALADGAHTDVHRFLDALAADPAEAARLWRGDPSSGAAPETLVEPLRRAYLGAISGLADRAAAAGDVDECVRWLLRAADASPRDPAWLIRAVRALSATGRLGSARRLAARLSRQHARLPDDVRRLVRP